MKLWLQKWRLLSVLAILALVLSGCGEPFLSGLVPAGEIGKQQYDLILLSLGIMALVIVIVVIIFTFAIIKFRRKDERIPKQVEGSHTLEIVWTVIPIILLLILAVPTVAVTFSQGDVSAIDKKDADGNREALVVNVNAHLYWWEFEYPDLGIVTSQDLVIPTDEKVYFQVVSKDVKHSFWIPPLGGKLDTNPENVNKFWLIADSDKAEEAGNLFYGKCAELCGPSHALMDFKVKALPQKDFENWVADMQNTKEPVEPTTDLAKQGEEIFNQSCITCHAVTPEVKPSGELAPNLAGFADRERVAGILDHNEDEIKKWIKDPEKIKPGNKMTDTYPKMSDQELDALAAYLMELKVQK
ncbi:cytochrome c oxidase subunit II [Bacillus norwichensis]|uniref:Cytochrome c oxidase subunit 2 n=1 Tax=Bacillus norwichensis TaxID=2762217 RepID=A0ABR8VQJ5_9BACI|nr:cytochrome c oxidase subunit II [Bacillus norwichensis]MBD8007029.1 cytochrome c oxidase subunit II [Bacillus norwichensis]